MKSCSSCGHEGEFGFVITCDTCFDAESEQADSTIESLTKKQTEILEYCRPHTDQMCAAVIIATILGCDFRDAKQKVEEYFTEK